jgi:regulation of enolase protein 1 (concanavalin A-like superfamily)
VRSQQAKIQASDKQAGDKFGYSVSISGDGNTAIAGAYNEDTGATDAGSAYIFTRSGTTWTQQAKIQASDKQAYDQFGWSVSISSNGNTAIVGAYTEDTGGTSAGAAYIFTRSGTTWTQQAKIQASDKATNDLFGYSVSISGDGNTAIAGALFEEYGGSAYIFTRSGTTWTQQAKIQASDKATSDLFGYSVSISGDGNTAIAGALFEEYGGSAYIFTRSGTTWTQQAKIQASDRQASDFFGSSVSMSSNGNTAIVGAMFEDTGGSSAGAAYIFTRSGTTWTQQVKIQASDKQASDNFGVSVAISDDGNTAIVGAYTEDTGGTNAGAAYIFTRSGTTWTQQAKIQASDKQASDFFGHSVAISSNGNTALVGAYNDHTGSDRTGSAYIFTRSGTTWTQQARIQASDKQASDNFGWSVAISDDGNTTIAGAYNEDTGGTDTGAAYIFEKSYYI